MRDILALDHALPATRLAASRALVPRMGEYLDASARLWSFIDGWRAQQ